MSQSINRVAIKPKGNGRCEIHLNDRFVGRVFLLRGKPRQGGNWRARFANPGVPGITTETVLKGRTVDGLARAVKTFFNDRSDAERVKRWSLERPAAA